MANAKKAAKVRHAVRSYSRANQDRPVNLQELIDSTPHTRTEIVTAVNELLEQHDLVTTAPGVYQYNPRVQPIAEHDGITHPPENDFLQ